ncbi:ParB family chromosome partitioning protein [Nocardioides ginsengisegetis]|uniref:ParB family chromosome partitioning protein n=1 Tax=Nocardioides ginsengisegetis TaxID=661491 RepID=A0A7W3PBN7_9ACTN|nr:ParB/RepB/Spo0J family partition protein [Nocardioides ginsengisegetis]MBA8805662.1 ParB family chromosome partitioning protein [Nocardioides ginsengisegetis]
MSSTTNTGRPQQRRGLGRGLGSLIPTAPPAASETDGASQASTPVDGTPTAPPALPSAPVDPAAEGLAPVSGAYFAELPLAQITPNAVQPRQVFDEEAMGELVHSIREVGLLQPVVVRRTGPVTFELVMGERRWRACQQAGLETIPAIVRETDDNDMLRDALLENLHRSQLNPLEEAAAYAQMLDDFGCTHEELATRIGRSRPQISNTLRLMKLSPAVQRRVAAGVLSAGHARALLAVVDSEVQDRLAARVVAEGISVRGLEEIVAVGDHGTAPQRVTRRKPVAPGLVELSDRLSDRLETRVKVDLGKNKGRITVEFASMDDLQRIVDVMDPRNRNDRPI